MVSSLVTALAVLVAVPLLRSRSTDLEINAGQRLMIDRLESVLLHDTVVPQYARVVNGLDGRGYVAGIGDFATADGAALAVIDGYTALRPGNPLATGYATKLATLRDQHSDDVRGLDGFPRAWAAAGADEQFRLAQDQQLAARYFDPTLALARSLGIRTPLGVLVLYDAMLQHGTGDDPDGLPALLSRARARAGGTPASSGETRWLRDFLAVRKQVLADPTDPAHQQVWPYAPGRVDALVGLLDGHQDLVPPLVIAPYGTQHLVDMQPFDQTGTPAPAPAGSLSTHPSAAPSRPPAPGVTAGPVNPPTGRPASHPPSTAPPAVRRVGPVLGIAGLCLDVNGGVRQAGNFVKSFSCNGTDAQNWTADTDGSLFAVTMCAQPRGDSLSPTTPVEIDPCDGRASQKWSFSGGALVNVASGLCLSVPGDSTDAGTAVWLDTCRGAAGQRWSPPGAPA